jgi:hypothetical protein
MASIREQFEIPGKMKTWSFALIGIGLVAFVIGLVTKGMGTEEEQVHFGEHSCTMRCSGRWYVMPHVLYLRNHIGHGWLADQFPQGNRSHLYMVPIFGTITLIVLLYVVLGTNTKFITGSIQKRLKKIRSFAVKPVS